MNTRKYRINGPFAGTVYSVAPDSDGDPELDDMADEAWRIAKAAPINILSDKSLTQIAVAQDTVVGAGFSSISNGEVFSFDVVVTPDAQRTGAGTALVRALEAEYHGACEAYPGLVLEVHVVDEGMMRLLAGRGYRKQWRGRDLLMRRENTTARRRNAPRKSYDALLSDLREIGGGVLGFFLISGTLRVCSMVAPLVAAYLQDCGHEVGQYGHGGPDHFDLSVHTSDRGWISVDPTYLQFEYKYDILEHEDMSDEEYAAEVATLAPLIEKLHEIRRNPLGVFRLHPLSTSRPPMPVKHTPSEPRKQLDKYAHMGEKDYQRAVRGGSARLYARLMATSGQALHGGGTRG